MLAQNHQRQPSAAQAPMRSRSGTAASSKSRPRPISRGSTTSDHSVGPATFNQHHPEQIVEHQSGLYMAHTEPSEQRIFQHGPEEMLLQYGQQIAQTQQYSIDPTLPEGHHNGMRPASQHGYPDHNIHQFSVMQGYPQGMPQYGIPQESINAQSRNLEGMENQSPAPDDSENAEPGAKKKKGAATSMANDAELRRLLQQYQGRTLKEVATEVQRKEGGEGKSEKAKQVFAMLW
jgi:regulatory factor X, other